MQCGAPCDASPERRRGVQQGKNTHTHTHTRRGAAHPTVGRGSPPSPLAQLPQLDSRRGLRGPSEARLRPPAECQSANRHICVCSTAVCVCVCVFSTGCVCCSAAREACRAHASARVCDCVTARVYLACHDGVIPTTATTSFCASTVPPNNLTSFASQEPTPRKRVYP